MTRVSKLVADFAGDGYSYFDREWGEVIMAIQYRALFTDANNGNSAGRIILLASVTNGNSELGEVRACVMQGKNAPLLWGQSA